jgi:hypothetical protein
MSLHQSHCVSRASRDTLPLYRTRVRATRHRRHVILGLKSTADPRSFDRAANTARVASDERHFVRVFSARISELSRKEMIKLGRLPSMRNGDQLISPRLFDNLELVAASSLQQ